jgi:predicted regulator of amino acid metabolism with ACT domain
MSAISVEKRAEMIHDVEVTLAQVAHMIGEQIKTADDPKTTFSELSKNDAICKLLEDLEDRISKY